MICINNERARKAAFNVDREVKMEKVLLNKPHTSSSDFADDMERYHDVSMKRVEAVHRIKTELLTYMSDDKSLSAICERLAVAIFYDEMDTIQKKE